MRTFDSETQKEPTACNTSHCDQGERFQELLIKALKEERKEAQRTSKKENRIIFLLSLFIFFIALFQTFSFFVLYKEIKSVNALHNNAATEENFSPENPPFPKDEIIQPLLKKFPPHA